MKKFYLLLVCCLIWGQMFAQITDSVSFSLSQIEIVYQEEYATLSFEGCSFVEEVGAPQLPYLKLHYLLPINQRVSHISLYDTLFVSQNLLKAVYPAQPPSPVGDNPPEFVPPNPEYYNAPFPNATVEVAGHYFMKGYQVVTINLYPIQ
jgi:hypothetical protein